MSNNTVDEGIVLQANGIVENTYTFEDIDRTDTIGDFIDKVNRNFDKLTGLLEPDDEDSDDMHDLLCDAVWIKPHQVIHRRRAVAGAGNKEDLMRVDWLKYVDYVYGDLAIVEQKRLLKKGNDVYMFTIKKDGEHTILTNKTLLSGPPGEDGVISPDTLETLLKDGIKELTVNEIYCKTINLFNSEGDETIIMDGETGSITCTSIYTDETYSEDIYVNNIYSFDDNKINIKSPLTIYVDEETSYNLNDKHNFEWGRVFMGLKNLINSYSTNDVYSLAPCDGTYWLKKSITTDKDNTSQIHYVLCKGSDEKNLIDICESNMYKNIYDALQNVYRNESTSTTFKIPSIDCMYNDLMYYMSLY